MSHGLTITASNVKDLDNYVLYRVWKEATTKRERSLAMKEIKRRQKLNNMSSPPVPKGGFRGLMVGSGSGFDGVHQESLKDKKESVKKQLIDFGYPNKDANTLVKHYSPLIKNMNSTPEFIAEYIHQSEISKIQGTY